MCCRVARWGPAAVLGASAALMTGLAIWGALGELRLVTNSPAGNGFILNRVALTRYTHESVQGGPLTN
jgi:hypothetical protein